MVAAAVVGGTDNASVVVGGTIVIVVVVVVVEDAGEDINQIEYKMLVTPQALLQSKGLSQAILNMKQSRRVPLLLLIFVDPSKTNHIREIL